MHDFNPGIYDTGLFWIIQVPDRALTMLGNTVKLHLENAPVTDNFFFMGPGTVASTVSLDITWNANSSMRQVRPASSDPLSPFHWACELRFASAAGTFSGTHGNGDFSFQGAGNSAGLFAEMGTERNGFFVNNVK